MKISRRVKTPADYGTVPSRPRTGRLVKIEFGGNETALEEILKALDKNELPTRALRKRGHWKCWNGSTPGVTETAENAGRRTPQAELTTRQGPPWSDWPNGQNEQELVMNRRPVRHNYYIVLR